MPVRYESGDLFATGGLRAFAHGCNCAGAMGKGIAIAFKQRWPKMYAEYHRRCKVGEFKLGDVFVWQEDDEFVFNLGTQASWTKKAELWAVEKALGGMIQLAEAHGVSEIAMPRIGAGLGGLPWEAVRVVLDKLGQTTAIELRVCDEFIAGQSLVS